MSLVEGLKLILWGTGESGTPPEIYKKRDIILLAFFCLATHNSVVAKVCSSIPSLPNVPNLINLQILSPMPSRHTKISRSTKRTTLRPFNPPTIEPGVRAQRNGVIVDAAICKAFGDWQAGPTEEDLPAEDQQHAPHAEGGPPDTTEPGRSQKVLDPK